MSVVVPLTLICRIVQTLLTCTSDRPSKAAIFFTTSKSIRVS